jgi:hypothetical protein
MRALSLFEVARNLHGLRSCVIGADELLR